MDVLRKIKTEPDSAVPDSGPAIKALQLVRKHQIPTLFRFYSIALLLFNFLEPVLDSTTGI